MSIFTARVNVFGVATYPDDPQVTIPFTPRSIALVLEDDTDGAYVCMNGNPDDAEGDVHLVPVVPGIRLTQQVTQIWLKRDAAGSDPTWVQIIAEL